LFKPLLKNLEGRITRISGQKYVPGRFSLEQLLVGLSHGYKKGVEHRLNAYASGRKTVKKLPCPVISIGNIVAGGAGKTPMTVYLADRLKALGYKPVVVSRGYKGALGKKAAVVGDGFRVLLNAETAGDEPVMMAGLKRFPVVAGKDRYMAGKLALDTFDADMIILDDGFQHLKLSRDLDIVLMDCQQPLGNGRLLPAGRLREPPALCRDRISCLVFTRCPRAWAGDDSGALVPASFSKIPMFRTRHRPMLAGWQGDAAPISPDLRGCRGVLFSGIARNSSFGEGMQKMGVQVLDHLEFPDHYRYKSADFSRVRQRAKALKADVILTTEKDWVKVDSKFDFGRPVGIMGVEIVFEDPSGFDQFLKTRTGFFDTNPGKFA